MTLRTPSPLILPVLMLFTLAGNAASNEPVQKGEPVFHFETGSPPWPGERIPLPPGFAPDLGWNGVEEIRFAPGMFDPEKPDFFSYILAFALQPDSDISKEGLQKELLTYYRGLCQSVLKNRGITAETKDFSITVENASPDNLSAPESADEPDAWIATLEWVEPFATRRPQTLHMEVHTWMEEERPVVLSCASPVDPDTDSNIWESLRAIRRTFRLE